MEIFHAKNQGDAAEAAAEAVNDFLKSGRNTEILLLLSGGSALAVTDYLDENLLDENLTLTMVDERFTADPEISNFSALQNTSFYAFAQEKGVNFIGTLPRPGETLEQIATRFETALRAWEAENPQGKILAVLGMGEDGHTAGIFPLPREQDKFNKLFLSPSWAVGYDNGGLKPPSKRITASLTFLKQLDRAIIFVSGSQKKSALEKVLGRQGKLAELPALIWHEAKSAEIFTDL